MKNIQSGRGRWLLPVLDSGTRFLPLSWDVSPSKTTMTHARLFGAASARAGGVVPAIPAGDKLAAFSKAFKKVSYRRRPPQPVHFAESHIKNEHSDNNAHERFNGTIRDSSGRHPQVRQDGIRAYHVACGSL